MRKRSFKPRNRQNREGVKAIKLSKSLIKPVIQNLKGEEKKKEKKKTSAEVSLRVVNPMEQVLYEKQILINHILKTLINHILFHIETLVN